jgi:hypothetical protein
MEAFRPNMNMKNLVLVVCSLLLLLASAAHAQNVGIGDPASPFVPTQRLHLKGNFLLEDGDFRPGNQPGTAGQFLRSAGPGVPPTWVDLGSSSLNGTQNYGTRWISNTDIGIGRIMDDNTSVHIASQGVAEPFTLNPDETVFMQVTSVRPRSGTAPNAPGPQSIAFQANSNDSVAVKALSTNASAIWGQTAGAGDEGVYGVNTNAGFAIGIFGESGFDNVANNTNFSYGVLGITGRTNAPNLTPILPGYPGTLLNSSGLYGVNDGISVSHSLQGVAFTDVGGAAGMYNIVLPSFDNLPNLNLAANISGILSDNHTGRGPAMIGVTSLLGTMDKQNPTLGGTAAVAGTTFMMRTFSHGIQGFASNTGDAASTGNPVTDGPGLADPATQGRTMGVMGITNSKGLNSAGVYGIARYTGDQPNYGVIGVGYSGAALTAGILGTDSDDLLPRTDLANNTQLGPSPLAYGVIGRSQANIGVFGTHLATTGDQPGVLGETNTRDPYSSGVQGIVRSATASDPNEPSYGVYGLNNMNALGATGVYGFISDNSATNPVYGVTGDNNNERDGSAGVIGRAAVAQSNGRTYGVYGVSASGKDAAAGVYGESSSTTANATYGIFGITSSNNANSAGVYGATQGQPNAHAGWFQGNVRVTGNLDVNGTKNFRIDHPLDPANKYLVHSCIEAPEALNLYTGIVTTDANGAATVELPSYFEALNKDFRYQLTCINQFAQAIVTQKISNNRFTIRTDKPNVEVSWTVTATRNDPAYRLAAKPAEMDKEPENKGRYLAPEAYNQPRSLGIGFHDVSDNPGMRIKQPKDIPALRVDAKKIWESQPKPDIDYNKVLDNQVRQLQGLPVDTGGVDDVYRITLPGDVQPTPAFEQIRRKRKN